MTTLTDLGVTAAKLRAYGHDGKFEALTGPQLQGVCCYLKSVLDKKEGKFKRWSKGVQKEMRGIGITQHQRTGEPCINYRKAKVVENISVSLEDFNRVEDELKVANEMIKKLMDDSAKQITPLREKANELIQANIDNAKSKPGGFNKEAFVKVEGDVELKPVKVTTAKRKRRTKEQIEADNSK